MGPISCPETSVTNYQSTPHSIPENRRSHLQPSGSLQSRMRTVMLLCTSVFHYLRVLAAAWFSASRSRLHVLGWVHTCNITAYRNAISWQCGRDSRPRNISKVGYAVTLRACSVCCRYLAVASKGLYGYGLSRCVRATSRCTYPPAQAVTVCHPFDATAEYRQHTEQARNVTA
jgi:hypothetical protein